MDGDLKQVQARLREFASDRAWEQFHTPRNLLLALVGEVGELAAEFQWMNDMDVPAMLADEQHRAALTSELADVAIYLLRLSDVLGVDLVEAIDQKLQLNAKRYPVEASRGRAVKYNRLAAPPLPGGQTP